MEDEQIEEWYAREKEKIADEYKKILTKASNQNIEKERVHFHTKMKQTIDKYNKMYHKKFKGEETKKKMHYPIKKLNEFMDQLSETFNERDD